MIKLSHIHVQYNHKILFQNSEINIYNGVLTGISGPSGSGKTTLFYMLGLMSHNQQYHYYYNDQLLDLSNEKMKSAFRKSKIGFVFQDKNLHEYLSIEDNLKLYAYISGKDYSHNLGMKILKKVRLNIDFQTKVNTLSGGEKQRLAIGCALIKDPELIIADEPTSALDDKNAQNIMTIFQDIVHDGKMVIIASHNKAILQYCDVVYKIDHQDIHLEKSCQKSQESTSLFSLTHLHPYFNRWYTHFEFGKSRFQRNFLCILSSLILSLCLFSFGARDTLSQQYKSSLNQYSSNEVYVKHPYQSLSQEGIERLRHLKGVKQIYFADEIYVQSLLINEEKKEIDTIAIVPYYDYQTEKFHLQKEYHGEIYLSYDLQQTLQLNKDDIMSIQDPLMTSHQLTIGGVFQQDYSLIQHRDKKTPCLYVPYHLFQYLESSSMVLELNSFEDFYQISENIKDINQQYQIILSQDTYLSQMNAFDTLTHQLDQFIIILFIIITVIFCINQLLTIYNQKYEISILKANGLSSIEILKMIMYWLCRQIIKSLTTISLLMILESFISSMFKFDIHLFNQNILFSMIILVLGLYFFPTIITTVYIAKIDIEKLLRF